MSELVAKVKGLTKVINGTTILNNINLEIKKGKIYGIIGRNGSGKSMLFKSLSGLITPTRGTIEIFNVVISNGKFPRDFGALFDVPGFIPHYSALKNLRLLASINNVINEEDIKKAITLVGLDYLDKKPVKKFSIGMKQRLGIAQAIMENPKFLILDEPMNGLDEEGVNDARILMKNMKEKGVTILMSSHNSEDIKLLCDYVYKIEKGSLFATSTCTMG